MDNSNSKEYLDKILVQVIENLKRTAFAPSVQMTDVPREPMVDGMDDEADAVLDDLDEDENKDKRFTKRRFDQYVEKSGELSESEDEDEAAANGVRRQKDRKRSANIINYRNLGLDYDVDSGILTPTANSNSSIADEEAPEAAGDKMEGIEDATTQDKAASDSSSRLNSRDGPDDMLADEPNGTPAAAHGSVEEPEEDEKAEESTETGFPDPIGADPDTTMEDVPMEGVETETAAASETRQASLRPPTPDTPAAVRLPSVSPAAPAEEKIQNDRLSDKAITPRAVTPSAPASAAPLAEEDSTPATAAPERAVTPAE
jgi:histone deacetylase 1/2